jgi:hypothetical protein
VDFKTYVDYKVGKTETRASLDRGWCTSQYTTYLHITVSHIHST